MSTRTSTRRRRVAALTLAGTASAVALAGVTVGAQTNDEPGGVTSTTIAPSSTTTLVGTENPFAGLPVTFAAYLSSGQQVPATTSTAWGQATFELAADGTTLDWSATFVGLPTAAAGHLHWAPPGQSGEVVLPLFEEVTATGPVLHLSGSVSEDDLTGPLAGATFDALVAQIAAGNVYVNVHTSDGVEDTPEPGDYPDGEIRGQVLVWTVGTVEGPGGTTTTTEPTTSTTGGSTTSTTGGSTTSTTAPTTSTTEGTTSTTDGTTSTTDGTTSTTDGSTTSTTEDTTTTTDGAIPAVPIG